MKYLIRIILLEKKYNDVVFFIKMQQLDLKTNN